MARSKITGTGLRRLLDESALPLYLLDQRRFVLFASQALLDWLQLPAERVLGQKLAYHSVVPEGATESFLHGLALPPHVQDWHEGTIFRILVDGERDHRQVWWIPTDSPGESERKTWLAIVHPPGGLPAELPSRLAPRLEAEELHLALSEFRQSLAKKYGWYRLVGESAAIKRVRRQVKVAADTRCATLIVGPAGSGREHIGRTIHYTDPRSRQAALIPINCGLADPETLTAALARFSRRPADTSAPSWPTVLLLEVDALSEAAQRRLEEFLASEPEWRVVSTSSRRLSEGAGPTSFSPQLATLLTTMIIDLPPLRDRRQDVPLLAQVLLEQLNATQVPQFTGFSREALDRLVIYGWPGGIDELAEVIRWTAERATGPLIMVADLPERLDLAQQAARVPSGRRSRVSLDEHLLQEERTWLIDAVQRARGNKSRAAKLLQISRARLLRRWAQLGLQATDGAESDAASEQLTSPPGPPRSRRGQPKKRRDIGIDDATPDGEARHRQRPRDGMEGNKTERTGPTSGEFVDGELFDDDFEEKGIVEEEFLSEEAFEVLDWPDEDDPPPTAPAGPEGVP